MIRKRNAKHPDKHYNNLTVSVMSAALEHKCTWRYCENWDYWETECGSTFYTEANKPSDFGAIFCCYCGEKIEEVVKDHNV